MVKNSATDILSQLYTARPPNFVQLLYLCGMVSFGDTIFAPATSVGTGAISVIRVSGSGALAAVDSIVRFRHGSASGSDGYRILFGDIPGVDEVLVSVFKAPHSYTGEDGAEISCHSSSYIVSEILSLLSQAGCRPALPGEFTQRAYLNGKMDLAQAEAVADIISSDSSASHRLALSQLKGAYSNGLRGLRDSLVELAALLELELDFSEEEVEFADRSKLCALLDSAAEKVDRLKASYRVGNAVKNGVPVAIVGAPNSGKSTLLNRLLGEDRAIVSPVPGTTRDTVEETLVLDGVRYRFIDTAGLHESEDFVENLGMERSIEKLRSAAIVILLLDSTASGSSAILEKVCGEIAPEQKLLVFSNKADLSSGFWADELCCASISALTGEGMDLLYKAISDCGFASVGDTSTVTSARHFSALSDASASLAQVRNALDLGLSGELVAEDLRNAISSLGSIFGEVASDEVLGSIFSQFCIGK